MESRGKRPVGDELASGSDEPASKRQCIIALDGLASAQKSVGLAQKQMELALEEVTGAMVELAAARKTCDEQKVERAKAEVERAKAEVKEAKAEVKEAEAKVKEAEAKVAPGAVAAPRIRDQLAGCVVKPAKEQYGKYLGHADTSLRDREEALRVLAEAAVRSVEATGDIPRQLVVFAGPSGSGKTRCGYEGSTMWDHSGGQNALGEALKGKPEEVAGKLCGLRGDDRAPGDNVLTLYIDLNNGLQYHSEIDKLDADIRLGARLAARALGWVLGEVARVPQEQLVVKNVLAAILEGQLARRKSTAPLLLVVHMDEWQLYMRALMTKQSVDANSAIEDVKLMFSALNSFASDPPTWSKGKFVLLPILSGTPVLGGVWLELTRRMMRIDGLLPALSEASASDLFAEALTKAGFDESEVLHMLRSDTARVGLRDTGCLPRLLVRLCRHVVQSVKENKAHGDEKALWHATWVKGAEQASADLPGADTVDPLLPLLALTGEAVEVKDPHGNFGETDMAKVVRDADNQGLVQLRRVQGDGNKNFFVVEVPFLMLRSWCSGRDFPEGLLRSTSVDDAWTWDEFERLYAHFTAARLNALLKLAGDQPVVRTLGDVIKGARGPARLLAQQVRLTSARQVHWEERQFMSRQADLPEKADRVLAAPAQGAPSEEIDLHAGVFLAKAGNSLFDMRYTFEPAADGQPAVHVFVQDKHTGTDTTVNTEAISNWYTTADSATTKWRATQTDSVVLLYFTNRKLTDPAALNRAFFRRRPRLLVVTGAELSDALTPAFVGRGLIPQNLRPTCSQ